MIEAWLLVVLMCPPAPDCELVNILTTEPIESAETCETMLDDYRADPAYVLGTCVPSFQP